MDVTGDQPTQAQWPAMYGGLAAAAARQERQLTQDEIISQVKGQVSDLAAMLAEHYSPFSIRGYEVNEHLESLWHLAAQLHDDAIVVSR